MATRIVFIAQKCATLKGQITALLNAVSQKKLVKTNARLRLKRVTELFNNYEEFHDELALLYAENEGLKQMTEIRDGFYDVAERIETIPGEGVATSNDTVSDQPTGNFTFIERQRRLELPIAELPKFNGDHNNWISYKNTFLSMVDKRTDIDSLTKFLYLRNSLLGAALNKISRYDASAENYKNAWGLLVESYEKKRILVAKHYDAILDIAPITKATSDELSRIIDDVRQHLNMLNSLGVTPDDGLIVRLLERALPMGVRLKWEESLSLDNLPTLEEFCKFINETAFRLCTLEPDAARVKDGSIIKRRGEPEVQASKARKTNTGAGALMTTASASCAYCQEAHFIYKYPAFERLTVNQRWDAVKTKRLCRNCLRSHQGHCNSSLCKRCNRFHHTLFHSFGTKSTTPAQTLKSNPTKDNSTNAKSSL